MGFAGGVYVVFIWRFMGFGVYGFVLFALWVFSDFPIGYRIVSL